MSEHDIHCEKENSPFQELYCYCEERAIVVKTAELKAENKTLRERVRELENPNPLVEIRVSPSEVYDPNGETWKQRAEAAEAKLAELKRTTVTTEYHDSIVHSWLVEKVALEALIAPARAAVDYLWEVKEWKLAANLNAALEKVK